MAWLPPGLHLVSADPSQILRASPGPPIPLRCCLGSGPWEPCQMQVIEVGREWVVIVGRRRIRFQHDGSGMVRMHRSGAWESVTPRWREDQSLCWGDLCVLGPIPLD